MAEQRIELRYARLFLESYGDGVVPVNKLRIKVSKDKRVVYVYEERKGTVTVAPQKAVTHAGRYWMGYKKERGQLSPQEINECSQALREMMWEIHRADVKALNRKRKKKVK